MFSRSTALMVVEHTAIALLKLMCPEQSNVLAYESAQYMIVVNVFSLSHLNTQLNEPKCFSS